MHTRSRLGILLALSAAACGGPDWREDEGVTLEQAEEAVRACATGPTVQGIDVSHYQGTINWSAVAGAKAFAIAKATEGTRYVDPRFAANWAGMRQAGIMRGAYHYFHPGTDPIAQANHFVNTMGPLAPGDLPPMLDLEDTDGLSPSRVAESTRRFLELVELRTGRRPMIYTGFYFWRDQVGNPAGFAQYPLVMAAYVSGCPLVPDSWGRFTMWQYSSSGRVPGISGNVDLDVFNGDLAALRALAHGTVAPPTPPAPTPPAPTGCGIFGWGSALGVGQGVSSCSGRFTLVHQGDGNAVLYDGGTALWATGTNGRATRSLAMQEDGNLVLYASDGRAVWASGTAGTAGAYLVMQDDGNLVLYAPGHRAIWATHTVRAQPPPQPAPPPAPAPAPSCGILGVDAVLAPGEGVHSCDGRFFFVHQGDGNVVLYAPGGRALWSTRTDGRSTDALVMQGDGNLVLYAPGARAVWSSGTYGRAGAILAVQDDGNVVVYDAGGRARWATGTNGR